MTPGRTVLAVDVGGAHAKLLTSTETEPGRCDSGPNFTPHELLAGVQTVGAGWSWDVVSLGIPTPVHGGKVIGAYRKSTFEEYVSDRARASRGKKKCERAVFDVVARLAAAIEPDYVVIGGGGVEHLAELPANARRGSNENAFLGGFRLWDPEWPPR